MERQQQYHFAHDFLRCTVFAVFIYGSGMVVAGRTVAGTLFDAFGFGPTTHALDGNGLRYAIFCFGVLGSVIVGWMLSLYSLLEMCALKRHDSTINHHGNYAVRRSARRGLFLSAIIWFLFDTTFSIVVGECNHALFNIPFVMLFIVPLQVMHRYDVEDEPSSWSGSDEKLMTTTSYGSLSTTQSKSNN